MVDVLSLLTEKHNTPVRARLAQGCPSSNASMLSQRLNMLIDRTGAYGTNGYARARVFGLRETNCIGYIMQPDGSKKAAVWHSKDGTRINGPVDENLARFVRAMPPRITIHR
jgi:hypothetical protein